MDKTLLRKRYIEIRKEITNKDFKSNIILNRIFENESFIKAKIIGIYVSMKNEVDTLNLINESLNNGKIVAVPKVIDKNNMIFYKINSLNDLVYESKFGIMEPLNKSENIIKPSDIDLFIIPGVCFDKNKNRIGFGGGYYDRYLSSAPNSYKIGISFDEQITDSIDTFETDIKLDEVITDKILIK